jgi:seryl-tRNA synthetase
MLNNVRMASNGELTVEDALNVLENLTELNGNLRNEVKRDIRTAVSCIKNEFVFVKSEVESANKRITELETRATETHNLLLALLDSVGGHREEEQETPSGQRGNYNGNHRKATEPTNGTKIRYADAVTRNKPGNCGHEKTKSHVAHSEGKKDETENY